MSVIVGGRIVPVDARVRTWHEHGLTFVCGKRAQTRAVVLHWTGGEGQSTQVYRTLKTRGLSVQFLIEQDGTIIQYTDADAYCSHAGGANAWTVGIEIANAATPTTNLAWPREVYRETIHGRTFRCARFYPEQLDAAFHLTRALCLAYGLPLDVPRGKDGELIRGVLPLRVLAEYRGVLGHYHLTTRKNDPGAEILQSIVRRSADK